MDPENRGPAALRNAVLHRTPDTEVEIRYGRIVNDAFRAGLSFERFARIVEHMDESYSGQESHATIHSVVRGDVRLDRVERSGSVQETMIQKQRVLKEDVRTDFGCDLRISSAREIPLEFTKEDRIGMLREYDLIRTKDRRGYAFPGYRVDLTVVMTTPSAIKVRGDDELDSVTYEVEIEVDRITGCESAWNMLGELSRAMSET